MAVVPAWAQAIWSDGPMRPASPNPQQFSAFVLAQKQSVDQVVEISTYSSGPSVSVPSSVVVPAGQGSVWVNFTVGPTQSNDRVILTFDGPTTMGEQDNWFE
jgi:hypothetical protein